MTTKTKLGLLMLITVSIAVWPFAAAAEEKEGVFTVFRVLVGKPAVAEAGGASVLIVPGTVVMLGKTPEQDASDVLQLMGKLKDSYRLGELSLAASFARTLAPEREVEVPAVTGDVAVRVTLLGFDETKATYAVSITKQGEAPSQARVLIGRGERGIVGSRDGAVAPYFFLTVEPLKPFRAPVPESEAEKGEITPPKIASRVTPVFPEQARKAGIDGVVILGCKIGADGSVQEIEPVRAEPVGLTEAAVDAVKQWRYEPARTATGKPVAVYTTITISFLLDRSTPERPRK